MEHSTNSCLIEAYNSRFPYMLLSLIMFECFHVTKESQLAVVGQRGLAKTGVKV